MKSTENEKEIAHFYTSEELFPITASLFDEQKELITKISPYSTVSHIGAASIPGALTIGDLDIHVQVSKENFLNTVNNLKDYYHINHPEMWTDEFALFHCKDHPKMPMSIVVVVKGSQFDEHALQTDLLRNDPDLLLEYNNLKRRFEGKSVMEYKKAKRDFFGPNGKSVLLKK
jgi:GrpB-like predicted nucleotidyltransferase (UPF0157 family)